MRNTKIEYEFRIPNNIIHGSSSNVTDLIDNLEIEFKMSQQRLVVLFWIFFFFELPPLFIFRTEKFGKTFFYFIPHQVLTR